LLPTIKKPHRIMGHPTSVQEIDDFFCAKLSS
jgi:hypothetical protein